MNFNLVVLLLLSSFCRAQQLPPIGEWRAHLPYNSAIDLAFGEGKIFAATPYSLISIRLSDYEIERMSRVSGLSETGISAIEYDESNERLLVAYTNSNLDIIEKKNIYNLPGILQSTVPGDKTVNNVFVRGNIFYLATGLGVILIDGERREVKETWYLSSAAQLKVNDFSFHDNYYYAASESGLKRLPATHPNPTDPMAWQPVPGSLANGDISFVGSLQQEFFAARGDSIFRFVNNDWELFYADTYDIINMNVHAGKLIICERSAQGLGRVTILNADGSVYRVLSNTGAVSLPRKGILVDQHPWIADQFASVSHVLPSGSYEKFTLNSPQSVASGEMKIVDGVLYVTAGAVNDSWNYRYNGDGIFVYEESSWNNINRYRFPVLDSLLDFITVAPEPGGDSFWAGSFGGGLLWVKPGNQFEIYKQGFLGETVGDPGSYRVAGLAFDRDRNLWVSNFGSSSPLVARKSDGSWQIFTVPFFLFERALSQISIDENNFKWIVSPLGNGVIIFDHGKDLQDVSDDRWRKLGPGAGNGNLPSAEVWSIAVDKKGMTWIGTSDGIAVVECGSEVFNNSCDAVWPVVANGNFSGYLFKGQQVRSIAVDGANRKWVATPNGVFLVSANGEKVIYHFTEKNSPLLSSDVRQLTIDGKTGEVFFATLKGICSFRSTATEGAESSETPLKIFPNPVPPGYSGTIGIRGLAENAMVTITELDGRLVYKTRALGGQAVWDGRNYRGQRIASGVYLVLVTDENGKDNVSGRIVVL